MAYANAWDETYPPGTTSADQIDTIIQYWAIAVRERMNDVLGISTWATATQPIRFSSLTFQGATPYIQGGTTSLRFRDSTNTFDNGTIADAGDYTARRNVIATNNLIANGDFVTNKGIGKFLPGVTSFSFRDFADANDNLLINDNGSVVIRLGLTSNGFQNVLGDSAFTKAVVTGGPGIIARRDDGDVSGVTTLDLSLGNNRRVRLIGNTTLNFSNMLPGGFYVLEIVQDGTGSRLITWPGAVKWPSGLAPTLSTGANKIDMISMYWNGANFLASTGGFNF